MRISFNCTIKSKIEQDDENKLDITRLPMQKRLFWHKWKKRTWEIEFGIINNKSNQWQEIICQDASEQQEDIPNQLLSLESVGKKTFP